MDSTSPVLTHYVGGDLSAQASFKQVRAWMGTLGLEMGIGNRASASGRVRDTYN